MIGVTRRLPGLFYTHKYTFYSILILLGTLVYFLFKWNLLCTNLQAWQHVTRMCKLYGDGRAVGTLCPPLCTSRDIHSLTCHSFQSTKEAVFSGEWHNTRLVFKSSVPIDMQTLHWYDNGVVKYPTEKEFLLTIRNVVQRRLNLSLPQETIARLSRLLPSSPTDINDSQVRHQEMDNLWILIQDNEYLLSTIYTDKDIFPQLLGTCGQYYAVEYIEPIQDTSTLLTMSDTRDDWGKRLKVAVQILELLDELENGFKEPHYLCDIKLQHFGVIPTTTKLKLLDLNNIYPKSIINKIITNIDRCERDEDCDFYDCRSKCIKSIKRCAHHVSNNNLQIVCEKIFLGWRVSNTIIIPGLLMSQHTPSELASILRQCANPDNENGAPRTGTDEETKKRLINILSEIEQSVNNDFFL